MRTTRSDSGPVESDDSVTDVAGESDDADEAAEADQADEAEEPGEADESDEAGEPAASGGAEVAADLDVDDLDGREWRGEGPYDVADIDLADGEGDPRIDLGSMIITGFAGAELRLQVADETQQIVSAMLISEDSALELGAYAAPRSGGLWPELREELIEAATEAGGSAAVVEGPFGVELRRLLPVHDPGRRAGLSAVPDVGGRRAALAAARHRVRPGRAGRRDWNLRWRSCWPLSGPGDRPPRRRGHAPRATCCRCRCRGPKNPRPRIRRALKVRDNGAVEFRNGIPRHRK